MRPRVESKAVGVREKNEETKRIKISKEKLLEIKNSYATKPIPNVGEKIERPDMKGGKVKTLFQSLSSNALQKKRAPSQSFYEPP